MRRRRWGTGFLLVLIIVIGALWWHGGREPLRPIEQQIPVPEGLE
ncbi:hypothetical protein [Erythrobacter litoralis]|uniref:Uncharacterized protein n=1 Tax=Erythrobacter litoralis (strain HTCC2594) TaxID=314225 RepID=Q2NB54_ERYLH|nr:hypothetical protein [Erythrobacter litoralis]ABC63087.1 hypothetical protein ELI_04975 [Erythrobacter litoralis HTCC2594]